MASLRQGHLRRIAAKTVVTGVLVAVPLIGMGANANAAPDQQSGPPSQSQPQRQSRPQQQQQRQPQPCDFYRCQPRTDAPPQSQWHHTYYPPQGFRDDPRAPSYPLGGYPPDLWWQVLQSLGWA
ncbi:hypothetical protein K7711_25105 [Nocardia sp. CA2R105]|uniref:hypothetical protein n=1 Tax=Nocardia coffeae TaxID=2873381 RepID=UPI001CA616EE|nr:hypothetical protein [Nocardia coffeae]MBY8859770.1 hypothetical protein [Nocardia coffeae]